MEYLGSGDAPCRTIRCKMQCALGIFSCKPLPVLSVLLLRNSGSRFLVKQHTGIHSWDVLGFPEYPNLAMDGEKILL